jgi:hypothetical protein
MKIAKDGRVFTRKAWRNTLLRIPESDAALWLSAAAKEGISRAEFVRQALREKAVKTLQSDNR